jgi:hypothetical protein
LTPPFPSPPGFTFVEGGTPVWERDFPHKRDWILMDQRREVQYRADLFRAGPYYVVEYGFADKNRVAVYVPDERLDAYLEHIARERGVSVEQVRKDSVSDP